LVVEEEGVEGLDVDDACVAKALRD